MSKTVNKIDAQIEREMQRLQALRERKREAQAQDERRELTKIRRAAADVGLHALRLTPDELKAEFELIIGRRSNDDEPEAQESAGDNDDNEGVNDVESETQAASQYPTY